jgi:hypothetical protein
MKLFARASAERARGWGRKGRAIGLALSAGLLLPLGAVAASGLASSPASASVADIAQNGSTYHAIQPCRLADTRPNSGYQGAGNTLSSGQILTIQTTGINSCGNLPFGGVPFAATAVVMNITAVSPSANGYLTAYASGQPQPATSTVNFVAGQTVANEATITIGSTGDIVNYGKVNILNYFGNTNVVVDLQGYYTPVGVTDGNDGWAPRGGGYNPIVHSGVTAPVRVLDTRQLSGIQGAGQTLGAQQQVCFYPGTLALPGDTNPVVPGDASAVVLNVTSVNATATSYFTVWEQGGAQPLASNLNFLAGPPPVPNRVIVPINNLTQQVCIFNWAGTADAVVDLDGYFAKDMGSLYYPLQTPARIADTRTGSGFPYAGQTLGTGSIITINVPKDTFPPGTPTNGDFAPAMFSGVDANVTVTNTTAPSYLTVYAANGGGKQPLASDLNWLPGMTVANGDLIATTVTVPTVSINAYNFQGAADLVIDIYGYFAGLIPKFRV